MKLRRRGVAAGVYTQTTDVGEVGLMTYIEKFRSFQLAS